MMDSNEQSKLEVLDEIEAQLNIALQNLVMFSIEPTTGKILAMRGFFSEVKELALQHHFRELGYRCMKNEEFLKRNPELSNDSDCFLKLAKRFGETKQCLDNLLAVAAPLAGGRGKMVCKLWHREPDELVEMDHGDQNHEISNLALGRILVLDDEMLVLNIIESVLRNRGYDVRITNDTDQALEIMRTHQVDILILDLVMPGKSGIAFYRELKQEKIVIPTIVLTASGHKADHIQALQEGIDVFLRKPFEADVLVANVEKLIKKEEKHKNIFLKDGLTSAYTRRFFVERFGQEKNKFLRDGSVFSVVFIDLDHFKEINDAYGHIFGDVVLKSFVAEFKNNFRPSDQIFRYGGDEFLLLLPQTDAAEAFKVIERIRENFQRQIFKPSANVDPITVTFSAGLTEFHGGDKTLEEILEEADRQLYRAKERGRACTSFLTDAIETSNEKKRVLICDDSSTVSRLIKSRLNRLGLETQIVANGNEALKLFAEFKPHLLILDIILPDFGGEAVLKEIRSMEQQNHVKVILISVKSLGAKEPLLHALGYDDFIQKPISLERLEQSVKRLL